MRRRSALSTLVLAGVLLAACSGGGDDTATTTEPLSSAERNEATDDASGDDGAVEPADEPVAEVIDDDLASAMWVFNEASFETNDLWRGVDADGRLRGWQVLPGVPTVVVADTADAHIAFVSDDLIDFRPVHRGCCGVTLADRLGDRIAIASVSPESTIIFASPDAGATWTTHEIAPLGGTAESPFLLTDLIVTDTGYMVTAAPARADVPPPGAVFTSADLATWTTVALPGLEPALGASSSIELIRGGADETWIVVLLDPGVGSLYLPFRSTDGGITIEAQAELSAQATAIAAVADRLVVWPAADETGPHPWLLVPDAGWARAPADPVQWGADGVQLWSWDADPESGRLVASIERFVGGDADGCDAAGTACELRTALVTSTDGLVWTDVDAPSSDADGDLGATGIGPVPAATGRDGWLIWEPATDSDAITSTRWTGPAPIPSIDPNDG